MIGSMSYEEMSNFANSLATSSSKIREIIGKYNSDKLNKIIDFCDTIDAYARFLTSYVELYQASDEALKLMIEKNK